MIKKGFAIYLSYTWWYAGKMKQGPDQWCNLSAEAHVFPTEGEAVKVAAKIPKARITRVEMIRWP